MCIFCHASHNASPIRPLWNRSMPIDAYTIYTSRALDAEPGYAEGQVLGLAQRVIAALEASGASVRPYPQRVARGWAFAVDALGPAQAHAAAKVLRVSDALRVECDPPV